VRRRDLIGDVVARLTGDKEQVRPAAVVERLWAGLPLMSSGPAETDPSDRAPSETTHSAQVFRARRHANLRSEVAMPPMAIGPGALPVVGPERELRPR